MAMRSSLSWLARLGGECWPSRGTGVLRTLLLLGGILSIVASPQAASAAEYVVLTSGHPSGEMSVQAMPHGRSIRFTYNDRGRGPSVTSIIRFGRDLVPEAADIQGSDYYKRPVQEHLMRKVGAMRWRSATDSGAATGSGFYWPVEETPEHLAMLARALLRRTPAEIDLLPAGRVRLEPASVRRARAGEREVRLFLLHGLGFAPRPLWLDDAGELVLAGDAWFVTVRRGFEGDVEGLLQAQAEVLAAHERGRAPALVDRPAGAVAFKDVAVFDAHSRSMRSDMTVVVQGGRIQAVQSSDAAIPAGARIIDGRGRSLLPGLFDMHAHVTENYEGLLYLASGVTTVRDMGNTHDLLDRKAAYDRGELPGPRVVPSGFIDGPGPLSGPIKVLAENEEQLRAAIRRYAEQGYPQIKLYSSLDPRLVPAARAEATRLGLRLSGHVPAGMTLRQAVEAGYDEVNHLNFVALNFMGPEINARTNGITRITAIGEHAWEVDPSSPQVLDLIRLLRDRRVVVDPTFVLYEDQLMGRPGRPRPTLQAVVDRLPVAVRRESSSAGLATTDAEGERNRRSYKHMQGLLKALYDGGVQLVPGTDGLAGLTLLRELELYVEAGIPPGEVLYLATLGAAQVAGLDAEVGSIEPGKAADLLLVEGAPISRMSDVRRAVTVVKDGVFYNPATLVAELGVAPDREAVAIVH